MRYTLTLACGCDVFVECAPDTGKALARMIERCGATCSIRAHRLGARVYVWELLPPARKDRPLDAVIVSRPS